MKRVLITGATGFIGGRLAEVLCEQKVSTVTLIRQWSRAARLSRLPVEMAFGDILDIESLRKAMKGCEVIFHCAVDFRRTGKMHWRSSADGTRNVMQAALDTGAQRVVFLSTIGVYGKHLKPGVMPEVLDCPHTGDNYGDGKIDAEKVAFQFHRKSGLPITVLRPTIVYGPNGRPWTTGTVAAIRDGRMALVNGGGGICNALYVDNLVEAMLIGAQHPHATGEAFHISDASPVTWKEFVEGHARALGDGYLPLSEMSAEEIEGARARLARPSGSSLGQTLRVLRDPQIRQALRSIPLMARAELAGRKIVSSILPVSAQRLLREKFAGSRAPVLNTDGDLRPRRVLDRGWVRTFAATTEFSIEKARRVLGYSPAIDFATGMELTAAWIKWARL